MHNFRRTRLLIGLLSIILPTLALGKARGVFGDFRYDFSGTFKPEMFYGKNISLLNNNNKSDRLWFARHTIDLRVDINYGQETYGCDVAELNFTMRDKSVWGNPNSIAATTEAETKILDAVGRRHKHAIPRHIFWLRELWLDIDLCAAASICGLGKQSFRLGAFPFELGRGIALGAAYSVGPEQLGFYSDYAIDQYAFGAKLSGDIIPCALTYDLYTAILQNKSSSLSDTAAKVRGQQYGHLENQVRGFGNINFILAGRLNWTAFDHATLGKATFEPYALVNYDPEQKVEFRADAKSRLGTFGLAGEYKGCWGEFGFDTAFNVGRQTVHGWDRNQVNEENRNGEVILVNSHVVHQVNNRDVKVPFIGSKSDIQKIVDDATRNEQFNGTNIGTVPGILIGGINTGTVIGTVAGPQVTATTDPDTIVIKNASNRFRNPYTNKYKGKMFVADGGVWVYKKDLFLAAAAGVASGDRNPNEETIDGTYDGFIGLQELYSGNKRVRSAFLLGGQGKLNRPLSTPESNQSPNRFAQTLSSFTNLVFIGTGVRWEPTWCELPVSMHLNGLAYWQERPNDKFSVPLNKDLRGQHASTLLGGEINLFAHFFILPDLKLFFVGSGFIPGQHFTDIKGRPLNSEQQKQLDRRDRTGFDEDRIPNIGDDPAYTFNIGLEFKF